MTHKNHDIGISRHLGTYSDAVEARAGLRWLFTSGTPGYTKSGELPPGIIEQSRLAWANVLEALAKAGMTPRDLVKVSTSLTDEAFIPDYVKVRKEILGDIEPAFMLSVIPAMVKPGILVEIEIVAAAE
jgi:enamine deaminase RidA (YjgF/YER057c/UK114 family)